MSKTKTITLGIVVALVGTLAVGFVAADGDLLNGPVVEEVETDGQIVVDGEFSEGGTAEVVVTAAEQISVSDNEGNTTISSGTEIFTEQNRTLEGDTDYPTDSVSLDVTGSNITSSADGMLEQDAFNVTVSLRDAANSTLNTTTVTIEDPGLFAGVPALSGENGQRNLLIGVILLVVGYLYIRD